MISGWIVLGGTLFFAAIAWLMGMAFASYARDPNSRFTRMMLGRKWAERSALETGGEAGRANIARQGTMTKSLALILLAAGLLIAFGIIPVDMIDPIAL